MPYNARNPIGGEPIGLCFNAMLWPCYGLSHMTMGESSLAIVSALWCGPISYSARASYPPQSPCLVYPSCQRSQSLKLSDSYKTTGALGVSKKPRIAYVSLTLSPHCQKHNQNSRKRLIRCHTHRGHRFPLCSQDSTGR